LLKTKAQNSYLTVEVCQRRTTMGIWTFNRFHYGAICRCF